MFRNNPKGNIQKSASAIKILVRIVSVTLELAILEIIDGPKSPITTKYAMHVPKRKPINPISIINFPNGPNT